MPKDGNGGEMDLSDVFQEGMALENSYVVGDEHTAIHVGSGSLRVLATPWMIAFMERTARQFLGEHLPDGYSSVGVHVNVRHLAPSPVGSRVVARAEIESLDGLRVNFLVSVHDERELLGEGTHQRVVIDEARFLRRVGAKT